MDDALLMCRFEGFGDLLSDGQCLFKPRSPIRIGGERFRRDLQRHVAVELGVSGSTHFARGTVK